jgi:hypothetical protein
MLIQNKPRLDSGPRQYQMTGRNAKRGRGHIAGTAATASEICRTDGERSGNKKEGKRRTLSVPYCALKLSPRSGLFLSA